MHFKISGLVRVFRLPLLLATLTVQTSSNQTDLCKNQYFDNAGSSFNLASARLPLTRQTPSSAASRLRYSTAMALDFTLADKVRKQIEFYFSDSNLPRDKFLLAATKKHPQGFVELATICTFTRVANLLSIPLNQSPDDVPNHIINQVAAFLDVSSELEVSPERDHVRRVDGHIDREKLIKELEERSIYSKCLPYESTLDDLMYEFGKYGPVKSVRMRYHPSGDFRGTAYVEYATKEEAQRVVKEKKVVIAGAPQKMEMLVDYLARKKSKGSKPSAPKGAQQASTAKAAPTAAENGDALAQKLDPSLEPPTNSSMDVEDGEDAAHNQGEKRKRDEKGSLEEEGPSNARAAKKLETVAPQSEPAKKPETRKSAPEFVKGVALQLEFKEDMPADTEAQFTYHELKGTLKIRHPGIVHVNYETGEKTALLRMAAPEHSRNLLAELNTEGELEIKLFKKLYHVKVKQLTGRKEEEFHENAQRARQAAKERQAGGGKFVHRRGRGQGRSGRGGGWPWGRGGRRGGFGMCGRVI